MLIAVNSSVATAYDDFKTLVAKYAPGGADIFYTGTTNLKMIYAIVRGEPGCKGEFPLVVAELADMSTFSISISGTVLVDFPGAVQVNNPLTITP